MINKKRLLIFILLFITPIYLFSVDNYAEIDKNFKDKLSVMQNSSEVYVEYALFLLEHNFLHEAIEQLRKGLSFPDAEERDVMYWLSKSYAMIGANDLALFYAKEHYERNQTNEEALFEYIWLLHRNLKTEEAIDLAHLAYEKNTYSFILASFLAILYGEINKYELAIHYYQDAEELAYVLGIDDLSLISNYYNQYLLEINFLQFKKAQEILEKALAIDPMNPLLLRSFGNFYHQQMNFSLALAYYQESERQEIIYTKEKKTLRTPLSKLELLTLYLDFNLINEAESIRKEIKREKENRTWMRGYGINHYFFDALWYEEELHYWLITKEENKHKIARNFWQQLIQYKNKFTLSIDIRRARTKRERSHLLALEYAKKNQHLENSAYYYLMLNDRRLFVGQLPITSHSPKSLLYKEIDYATKYRDKTKLFMLLDNLQLPYQNKEKVLIIKNILINTKLKKGEHKILIEELYRLTPHLSQPFGMFFEIDMENISSKNQKKIKRALKRIGVKEESSPFLLRIEEAEEELRILLFEDSVLRKEWQVKHYGYRHWRILAENIRKELFASV
ncbi:tetratricopeptide repeat protein [Entomospira culicis]|uniref:Tetratricopeptide repeat protein n=1 Tax=Entomospira culicis TaxID=2719989 RepID=A0A968GGD7_9SPIO|nr:hypothetical protein [Entomospira culicis]NIZ19117.1 hypothetical protein [Entomospira culicis]NIZ69331.1 hypothetical protein [Entomospira culicis]WDI37917.1 hypothetical protein PVA46_03775 [Entomospira culicis]WDI39544.1 hypothetical protein PVA47_03775 [Entomospira culicis]